MELLLVLTMVGGLMIFIWGWGASTPKNYPLAGSGFLLMMGVFCAMSQYAALGILCQMCGICLLIYSLKTTLEKNKKVKQDKLLEIGGTPLDRFFVECVLSSCDDFSLEKNVARAQLLANKYKLSYPNGIQALYRDARTAHEAVSGKVHSDDLESLREKEREVYADLNRYANYVGKEKKVAMLTDRMKELRAKAKSLDDGAEMLIRSTTQKEQSWSVWGGIADGLAGPAAGVATALDIQNQNAQIRARNEANRQAAMPAFMAVTNSASRNRANADAIEKEIALLQEKLMTQPPRGEVLSMLNVIDPTVEVSKTGAFRVTATVEAKQPLYLYGDVPAVADGTILAQVYEDGVKIGSANMVLPVNGVSQKASIAGICLSGAHPGKKHTVEFTEKNLWLLEK